MQYPVPQFIEEEGKIVFFMTFRQFFILVGGGAACTLFYFIFPFWLFITLSLPIMLSAVAVAFIKIGNESITSFFLHVIGFSFGEKNYIWSKKELSSPLTEIGSKYEEGKLHSIKKVIETKK